LQNYQSNFKFVNATTVPSICQINENTMRPVSSTSNKIEYLI